MGGPSLHIKHHGVLFIFFYNFLHKMKDKTSIKNYVAS